MDDWNALIRIPVSKQYIFIEPSCLLFRGRTGSVTLRHKVAIPAPSIHLIASLYSLAPELSRGLVKHLSAIEYVNFLLSLPSCSGMESMHARMRGVMEGGE